MQSSALQKFPKDATRRCPDSKFMPSDNRVVAVSLLLQKQTQHPARDPRVTTHGSRGNKARDDSTDRPLFPREPRDRGSLSKRQLTDSHGRGPWSRLGARWGCCWRRSPSLCQHGAHSIPESRRANGAGSEDSTEPTGHYPIQLNLHPCLTALGGGKKAASV